ncbi:MAG: rod shape-determining protein MreD [Actinomycetota bacterium]
MTRRVLVTIAIVITALLLQSTLFWQLKLVGVRPELMYLVTIVIAILEGPQEGAVTGFFGGMAQDFLLNQPKGITALTLTLVGYAAGLARQYVVSPSPLLPTILVGVGTAAGVAFYQVVAFLLGQLQEPFTYAVRVTLLTALYGAILTPILYPLLRRVIEGSRPTRVVRF